MDRPLPPGPPVGTWRIAAIAGEPRPCSSRPCSHAEGYFGRRLLLLEEKSEDSDGRQWVYIRSDTKKIPWISDDCKFGEGI
jgi:hypothetical protein